MRTAGMYPVVITSLWLLRLALVFLPQTGYIHPDEFFQSVEIAADDILGVEGQRTWEFNASFPIRSATLIHATAGLPLYLLQIMDYFVNSVTSLSLLTPYTVLIVPRLWLTVLSFIGDICVWNLGTRFAISPKVSLLLYASSYVTTVFYTRMLSNTTESLLFNILLLLAASDLKSSQKGSNAHHVHRQRYIKEDNTDEGFGNIWNQTIMNSVYIGLLVACGVFNRPTFVLFAMVPVILWLQNSYSFVTFVVRLLYLAVGFFLASAVIVSLDTVYYKTDLVEMQIDLEYCLEKSDAVTGCVYQAIKDHFVFTPWNFFVYNTNVENLESHGSHPWYLHLTVNTAILFGPLGTIAVGSLLKACWYSPKYCLNWTEDKVWPLLWIFYLPILLLSGFPHQEPRFIIPLLTPIVLLAARVFKSRSTVITLFTMAWVVFNVFGLAFFGFFHQGGVVQSLLYLQAPPVPTSTSMPLPGGQKVVAPGMEVHHFIYFHTYMPPEHLLLRYKVSSDSRTGYSQDTDVSFQIHDLKGGDDNELIELISVLRSQSSRWEKHKVYVVAPFTRIFDNCNRFSLRWVQSFSPHLSMEDPPNMLMLLTRTGWKEALKCLPSQTSSGYSFTERLKNIVSLVLLQAY